MTSRTTQAFWKCYKELPEQIKREAKKHIEPSKRTTIILAFISTDTFDPRYLLIAHYERLSSLRDTARQTDNMVLDRFSRRLQQSLETTKNRITRRCNGSRKSFAPVELFVILVKELRLGLDLYTQMMYT